MIKIVYFLFAVVLLASCSHVNNIKPKELYEKKVYYEFKQSDETGKVIVDLGPDYFINKRDNLFVKAAEVAVGIAKGIGTSITASNLDSKLFEASRSIGFKHIFIDNMSNLLLQYEKTSKTTDINDNYDFIAHINLEKYEITANRHGVYLFMEVYAELNKRFSAEKVWSQRESKTIQLDFETGQLDLIGGKTADFIQLINMNLITEEKIYNALKSAANNISKDLNAQLIEDIQSSY